MSLVLPARFEIVRGEIIPLSPTGGRHGEVESNAILLVGGAIKARRVGRVYAGEVGVVIAAEPQTVRGADMAWVHVSQEPVLLSPEGYLLTPPTLVVEVLSPNDRASEVETKTQEYLQVGVRLVLLLDPQNRCATLARPDSTRVVLSAEQTLELPDLLPDWSVSVASFFED